MYWCHLAPILSLSQEDFVDEIGVVFTVPNLVDFRTQLYGLAQLTHREVWIAVVVMCHWWGMVVVVGVVLLGLFLEDFLVDSVEILHDVLLFGQFSHQLGKGNRSEEILRLLVLGSVDAGLFGHCSKDLPWINDLL